MERMDVNPTMEDEPCPIHGMDATEGVPEEVTLDSDDDVESESEDDVVPLSQTYKGKAFGGSTSSASRIAPLGRQASTTKNKNSQPDVIDLTKEEDYEGDDDDIMITDTIEPGQNQNNTISVEEDVPELIEVEQVPVPNEVIAEGKKKQGNDYFKLGQYYQALGMYTAAIEAMPSEASYYGNRSACHMMLKKYKEALDDIKKALQLDPGYEKGYLRQIRTTLALGNIKECEMAFETVARLGLKNVDAKSEHDKLQWLKRHSLDLQTTKAKKDYRKLVFLASQALEVATADNDMKMIKADALLRIGRHSEAQEICTEVLQNDVRCPEALYTRALLYYYEDNPDKSIQFARQGLQFAPDNSSMQNMFKKMKLIKELRDNGASKFLSGRYDDAKNDYSRCLTLVNEGGDMNNITLQSKLYFNLALIAHKLNKLDESLQACGKAIELNSKYLKAIIHRAKIYNQKEMYDDAVHDYEAALRIDPSLKHLRRDMQDAKTAAKRAKRKDYYKILNIEKNATDDEIRKAYKKRALVHHPDRHANATEAVQKEQERLFKDLGEAYEVLSDQKKRFRYDQGVDLMDDGGGFHNAYEPNNDFINVFFGQGGIPSFRPGQGAGGARGPHQFHHTFRH